MAARKKKQLADKQKDSIRATQIMNRLEGHINGQIDLSPTQISAAKIVLGKIIPDLKSIDNNLRGDPDKPLSIELTAKALKIMTKEQLEALLAEQSQDNSE